MAWGLCNSNQPFLWVIRPGSILGSDGLEVLPNEISTMVLERGYIVKRAPRIESLWMELNTREYCGRSSTDFKAFSKRAKDKRSVLTECLGNRDSDGR
ncbi:hypothetical protein Bca52824_060297 [Brassica carinata]|uniref:Uncharacterized protein n=1 Tax=Brassica carinata TaxID=52824 RepID=A0A8X7UGD8_BRACI|nr:hypothetical protein Bca52824_060297 [Brassica carinata]